MGSGAAVKANADTADATGTTVSSDGLVERNRAVGDGERPGCVEDPTAATVSPVRTVTSDSADRAAPRADCAIGTVIANGDVVQDGHRGERHLAPGVQDSATVAGCAAVLDRHLGDRHLATEDLEDPIQVVAVDDGAGRTLPLDGEIAGDVQVAGGASVLPGTGDGQLEGAGRQDDGVGTPMCVGSLDRRPQRDVPGSVLAVAEVRGHGVERRVDLERREHHAAFKPLEHGLHPWRTSRPSFLLRREAKHRTPPRKKTDFGSIKRKLVSVIDAAWRHPE